MNRSEDIYSQVIHRVGDKAGYFIESFLDADDFDVAWLMSLPSRASWRERRDQLIIDIVNRNELPR